MSQEEGPPVGSRFSIGKVYIPCKMADFPLEICTIRAKWQVFHWKYVHFVCVAVRDELPEYAAGDTVPEYAPGDDAPE